jgi:hypothetical protein
MGRGKAQHNLDLVRASYDILAAIHPASVRATSYQLFNAKLIPDMSKASTDRVSKQLTWARKQGIIPWDWIVDEVRRVERRPTWADPDAYANTIEHLYCRDRWAQQPQRVLVVSEKGTVRGTVAPVTQRYGVGFLPMHGYGSTTAVHDLAVDTQEDDRPLTLLYIGDYDPSGMHMSTRDLPDRMEEFGGAVTIIRLALTREDVADPQLPWFSAADKKKDARCPWFTTHYGHRCWEVDALSPVVLRDRLEQAIIDLVADRDAWNRCRQIEEAERETLVRILGEWRRASA